jgi:hypothetical protein
LFQLQKINATSVKFLSEYTKNEKGTSVDQTRKVWVILLEIKLRYKTNKQTRKKERKNSRIFFTIFERSSRKRRKVQLRS